MGYTDVRCQEAGYRNVTGVGMKLFWYLLVSVSEAPVVPPRGQEGEESVC